MSKRSSSGIHPDWMPSDGGTSSRWCLKHRAPVTPPPLPRTRHQKRVIKAQVRACLRARQNMPATSADLASLQASFGQ